MLLTSPMIAGQAQGQEADLSGVGYVLGSVDAPVTVVEYGDFACSACAQFARDTWPTIRERYVEAGRVRWRMVPFELGFRNSDEGARAAQCAAEQDAFWQMHDALFLRREEWVGERRPGRILVGLAAAIGIDAGQFEECYDEGRGRERTEAANRAAHGDGVRGTPTFFIGGFRVQGAIPLETFVELIERATGSLGSPCSRPPIVAPALPAP